MLCYVASCCCHVCLGRLDARGGTTKKIRMLSFMHSYPNSSLRLNNNPSLSNYHTKINHVPVITVMSNDETVSVTVTAPLLKSRWVVSQQESLS
jgi:hypothetical protein